MLNLKTAELYMLILHSRSSKSYGTKNNATSRDDCLCIRNSLCLVIKKWQFECENLVLFKTKTSNKLLPQGYLYFFVFLYGKDISICLVGQIDFNASTTCLRIAFYGNLLVFFFSIIQKTGAMCKKTGIFKLLRIQLQCRTCFRSNLFSINDMPR